MSKIRKWLYNEEYAKKMLNIATTVMQCDRDPVENRRRIAQTVNHILKKHPDTELVVFGEMVLNWYDPLGLTEYHHGVSEAIPGKTTELLSNLSKKFGIFICCGISEKTESGYHNSQVLIDPQGEIQAIHRKWNLKYAEQQIGYISGPTPITITEINGVKTGIIICADAAHPKTMRELMQSNLDLILFSLADDKDEKWFLAKTNARLYDAWIVSANRVGMENIFWNGHTVISDPLGDLQKVLVDEEGYLIHNLKFAQDQSKFQSIIRNIYVKLPLLAHVIKNWKILRSYYK